MDAPVFIHHKQAGPQRRFQKILQALTQSNSSNSLHQSHSSKQSRYFFFQYKQMNNEFQEWSLLTHSHNNKKGLNIHEELIKLQIEQTKEGCNKFYTQQPFPKQSYHSQNNNDVGEKVSKRNEDLVKALQQQQVQLIQNEKPNQEESQQLEFQNIITNSQSNKLNTNLSISSLPQITDPSQEKQLTNQDNNSYYDPDIPLKEQNLTSQKHQFGSLQKGRNLHKGSNATLHEIVNKQLQAIRQSRKSLHKDLSFNSINQNSVSIVEQNSNLRSNTDNNNSSSTHIFMKKDLSHSDQAVLNMQAYQIRMKEDKIPYYLQNQLPQVNVSNTINLINNSNTLKYNLPHFKTESIQNSLKNNNLLASNITDPYQPKYKADNATHTINTQKIYKKRNHSLNNGQNNIQNSSAVNQSANMKMEYKSQQLYAVDTNSIPKYLNQNQSLNKSQAKRDFSLDSKIQSYNTEELTPVSKPIRENKRHTQKITVVRKFNITETTIHKIQQSDCNCQHSKDQLNEDDEDGISEDSSQRFLTARSKDNFKQDNPIKKIILRRDSFDQQVDQNQNKDTLEITPQTNISDRMTKIKLIQNQGYNTISQKSPTNQNSKPKDGQIIDYSSSDEKNNFKTARSNKKKVLSNLNTPLKGDKLNKTTIGTDNENEQESILNSPSLPPILVCTSQEIYKKLYKVKRKKRSIEPQQEEQEQNYTLAKINSSKRSSYKQGQNQTRKSIGRQSQNYGSQQNQENDHSLISHTHVQLNQQIMQQQPQNNLPQIPSLQTNPIYQQNKYMPEIKEEFSQSSRQYYTDGRISSTYTRAENLRQSKNFTPEEIQSNQKSLPEFKILVSDLIKCICEFEIISSEETDTVLESYLYNIFAQKNKLQNQLQILNTKEQLSSNAQALINAVKLLIKQQNFIQQYPFHKAKFDLHISNCEKAIKANYNS